MDPNEWADSAVVEEAPIPTPPETKAAAETPSVQPAVQAAPHPKIDPKALRTQARMAQALHDVYYGGKAPGSDYEQDFLARVKFAQDKISAGDFDDGPTSDQYFRSLAQYHYHQQRAQGLTPKFDQSDLNLKKEVQNLKLASMIAERQQSGWHDARMAQQQRNVVSGMPVVGAVGLGLNDRRKTKELEESVARFEQGEADDIDLSRMANAHAAGEFEKGQGKLAKIGDFMPKLLAMYGEAMMLPGGGFLRAGAAPTMSAFGGQLSRGAMMSMGPRTAAQLALTTAAMPSMYAESAIGQNTAEGRAAFDPRGFGSAGAHTMAQLAVLGVVGKGAQGVIGKFLPNAGLAGETAATAAMAPFTMAATELVTNAAGIDTGWGTLGHLWRGEGDAAIVKAATDILTFGTLHAVNNAGQPRYRALDMKAFADALKEAKQRGFSAQAAAALASARMNPAPGKSPGELIQGSANKLIQDRASRYGVDQSLPENEMVNTSIGPMTRSQAFSYVGEYGFERRSPEKTVPGQPVPFAGEQPASSETARPRFGGARYGLAGESTPPIATEPTAGRMPSKTRARMFESGDKAGEIVNPREPWQMVEKANKSFERLIAQGVDPEVAEATIRQVQGVPETWRGGQKAPPEGQVYTRELPEHWQNRRNPLERPPEPGEPDFPVSQPPSGPMGPTGPVAPSAPRPESVEPTQPRQPGSRMGPTGPLDQTAAQQVTEPPKTSADAVKAERLERMRRGGRRDVQAKPGQGLQTDLTGSQRPPGKVDPLVRLKENAEAGQISKNDILDAADTLDDAKLREVLLRRVANDETFEETANALGYPDRQRAEQLEKQALKALGVKGSIKKLIHDRDRAVNQAQRAEKGEDVKEADVLNLSDEDIESGIRHRHDLQDVRDAVVDMAEKHLGVQRKAARSKGLKLTDQERSEFASRFNLAMEEVEQNGHEAFSSSKKRRTAFRERLRRIIETGERGDEPETPAAPGVQGEGQVVQEPQAPAGRGGIEQRPLTKQERSSYNRSQGQIARHGKLAEARAAAEKQAKEEMGVKPAQLQQAYDEVVGLHNESIAPTNKMISEAYGMARRKGQNLKAIMDRQDVKSGDAAKVPGLDDIAHEVVATNHPEVPESERVSFLFDALRNGKLEPLSFGEAYEQALEKLRAEVPQKLKEVAPGVHEVEPGVAFGGIPVPPVVIDYWNRLTKWAFTNRSVDNVPPVRIDRDHLLPRPQSWGDDKLIASDPHELGKLGGLGKIADPRARAETPEDQAIVGWAYGYSKSESLAALWRASQHEYAGKLFRPAPDGKRIILSDGSYGYMGDVIEKELRNPGSQKLSQAERDWLNDIWKPLSADMRAFIEEYGIKYHDENGKELKLNEFFFPHTSIGKEGVEDTTAKGNARHGRLYESEEAGATGSEKILYDQDFLSRASKQYAAIYHAYYDKMLANDPALRGETVKERFEALKERHADEIAGLEGRELRTFLRDLRERANHVVFGKEARVDARPGFYGKIYPAEVAKKLNAMFGETGYGWIKGVQNVARQSQAAVLAVDVSAPMNQLLPLLFTNPIKWASLYPKMVKSWFDPEIAHRTLSHPEYMNAAQRFVQGGGTLFRFHDFLEGAKKGEWVTRLPFGIGKMYEKSAHAMGVAMDIAKLERFMAEDAKGIAPKDLAKTIESIENSLGMGRMRQIGVSEGQMALERIFLALAPSYYRAAAGHIGGAISAMPSLLSRKPLPAHERVALRSLGHFMAGITAFSVAAMIAAGLDMDEITDRLKPWKGKFLKVPIDFLGTEVGLGNIVTSMLRLAGDAIEWHFDPNPINTGVDGNPWLRFYRSHAPAGPKFGIDAATGKDFNNERQTLTKSAVKSALPVAVQQGVLPSEEGETAGQRAAQAVFSFFGMTAFPKRDSYAENLNQTAKRMTGLSYEDLNLKQQEKVVKATERVPSRFTPAMAERMEAYRQARQQLLMNDLSKSSRMNLAEVARQVPAYNRSVSQGGKTIPLNDRQVKEYHDYLVEEYDREIGRWNMSSLMAKSGAAREKFVNSSLETARKKARARLR